MLINGNGFPTVSEEQRNNMIHLFVFLMKKWKIYYLEGAKEQ